MKDLFNKVINQLSPIQILMVILLNSIIFVCICLLLTQMNIVSQELAFIYIKGYLLINSAMFMFAIILINQYRHK